MRLKHYLIPILNAKKLLIVSFLLAFLLYMLGPYNMIYIKAFAKLWGPDWLPETWGLHAFKLGWRIVNIPKILMNSLLIAGISDWNTDRVGFGKTGCPREGVTVVNVPPPQVNTPHCLCAGNR
jgi:hypothetical protein